MKEKDIETLQHTTWRCQYHIVFAPKYRRMAIYGQIKQDIGQILRKLCEQKGVEIIEAQACSDHIHMLLSIPPKYSVSQIMGYLKGKSSLMIFDRHANLKYKYGDRHFWARTHSWPLEGRCPYYALLGLTQAPGLAGGPDCIKGSRHAVTRPKAAGAWCCPPQPSAHHTADRAEKQPSRVSRASGA